MDALRELQQLAANNNGQWEKRPLSGYVMSQADLASADIPTREFLIAQWLPMDSYGMVYAARGVGKTWFAMSLALAIAAGSPFLRYGHVNKSRVLYVDGEMTLQDLKQRLNLLTHSPPSGLFSSIRKAVSSGLSNKHIRTSNSRSPYKCNF